MLIDNLSINYLFRVLSLEIFLFLIFMDLCRYRRNDDRKKYLFVVWNGDRELIMGRTRKSEEHPR
jgi:hypothetical protein